MEELKDLQVYAAVFKSFTSESAGARQRLFFKRLDTLDVSTLYPFLLFFFREHGRDADSSVAVIQDLESFLVRRLVCRLTTKNYNRLFLELVRWCKGTSMIPTGAVREFLLASAADSSRWPDDDEFRLAWLTSAPYRHLVRARVRMILETLEQQLHGKLTEAVEFNEQLTVEHLLPQKWETHWPLPEGEDPRASADEREMVLHTFGNLTLINGKLNPHVSNGPWSLKKGRSWSTVR